MARREKDKSTQVNSYWEKAINVNAPVSLEYLMVKEMTSSLEDGDMRKLPVHTYPYNEYSTRIKQKIRILDHPKNLIDVLRARLTIAQGLTGNNITTGTNQHHFTRIFLYGEALCIFDLKSTELRHETAANLILVMNHVVTYFGPKDCLSKQKH